MSLTLNLLQVSKEGKNQAVYRNCMYVFNFILGFNFLFFFFSFFLGGGGGLVMYDNDMIMSLKQKKVTVICRIHYGLL